MSESSSTMERENPTEPLVGPVVPDATAKWWWTNGTNSTVVTTFLFAALVFSFGFTAMDTMATPLMADQFGIDIGQTNTLFIMAGISSAVAYICSFLTNSKKWISLTGQLVISAMVFLIGAVVMIDYQAWFGKDPCQQLTCSFAPADVCSSESNRTADGCHSLDEGCIWTRDDCTTCAGICRSPERSLALWQLYLGFVLNNLSFTIGRLSVGILWGMMVSVPSGAVAPEAAAMMQSYYETSGNLARIFGPILCMSLYSAVQNRTYAAMLLLSGLSILMLMAISAFHTGIERISLIHNARTAATTAAVTAASGSADAVISINQEHNIVTVSAARSGVDPDVTLDWKRGTALTLLVVATNFSFGLPLPSLKALVETSKSSVPPGLDASEATYSWMVALFSIGAFVGAPSAGYIQKKWSTFCYTINVCNLIGLIGAVLCGLATSVPMLGTGRFLIGFWMGGMNVVFRTYVGAYVGKRRQPEMYSLSAFFCALSWAISPAIGAACASISFPNNSTSILRFDGFRAPGWIIGFLALSSIFVQRAL